MMIRETSTPEASRQYRAVPLPLSGPLGGAELVVAAVLALACLAVTFGSLLAVALLAADLA